MSFTPQQRYTSEGEPELGVGIVTDVRQGRVQLYFPGADVHRLFAARLRDLTLAPPTSERAKELSALIEETADFQRQMREKLAQGRDRLLELNSYRPAVAEEIVQQIEAADRDLTLEQHMTRVFEAFAVEMEDLGPRSYLLSPAPESVEAFPGVPQEGIAVSFSRSWALSREDASFLSWDHPLATGTLDRVLSSGYGGASYGSLRDGQRGLLLEAMFVLEIRGGEKLHPDRFLPPTPIRVVVDHAGHEQTEDFPAEWLDQRVIHAPMEGLLENEVLMETVLPNMIAAATALAERRSASHIMQGLRRMRETLSHEIERLAALQAKNPLVRPEEIRLARDTQDRLTELMQEASIRLDAVQLIGRE